MLSADGSRVKGHILSIALRLDGQLGSEQTLRLVLRDMSPIHNVRNELGPKR